MVGHRQRRVSHSTSAMVAATVGQGVADLKDAIDLELQKRKEEGAP